MSWLGAALLTAAGTHGAPPLELEWQAPAGCPDREWALGRLASDQRLASVARATHISVRLTEEEGVFRAELLTTQGEVEGTRTLEGGSCQELADAVIVVLGMALVPRAPDEPVASSSTKAVDPSPKARADQPPAAPEAEEAAHESRAEPGEPSTRPHAYFRAGIGLDRGSLPAVTFGPVLAGGWSFGSLSIGVRGAYWLPRTREVDADAEDVSMGGVGGKFSQLEAAVAGCWSQPLSMVVALEGCLGVGVGLLRAEGYGVPDPGSQERFFGFGEAELGLPLWLSAHIGLRLGAGLTLPMSRETYAIENLGPIYTPAPVGFRGALTGQVRF